VLGFNFAIPSIFSGTHVEPEPRILFILGTIDFLPLPFTE
jgi:hypothetical protein